MVLFINLQAKQREINRKVLIKQLKTEPVGGMEGKQAEEWVSEL